MQKLKHGEAWFVCLSLLARADKLLTREELSQRMALHQAFLSQRWGKPMQGVGFVVTERGIIESDFLVGLENDPEKQSLWISLVDEIGEGHRVSSAGKEAIASMDNIDLNDIHALGGYASDAGSDLVNEISVFYRAETMKTSRYITRLIKQAMGLPDYLAPGQYSWREIIAQSTKESYWRDYVMTQVGGWQQAVAG